MRLILGARARLAEIVLLTWVAAGCSGSSSPGAGGSSEDEGGMSGEPVTHGSGGAKSTGKGGSGAGGGSGGAVMPPEGMGGSTPDSGGAGGAEPEGSGGTTTDASTGTEPDESTAPTDDGGSTVVDSNTPMNVPGQPKPSYDGQIPIYYGPEVGPIVKMDCPDDPTAGWKEYKESFHVEHPYTLPTNTRFSITGGIYNFWVFPNDAPHSPTAQGRNPRTEANYGGTYDKTPGSPGSDGNGHFTSGQRLYSADMLIEKNAIGSAIMQIHTTATGGGPIGIRMQSNSDIINNGSLKVVDGSKFPGGLVDKWFNYKASLNADTMEVKIYINNCLQTTYKGDKGDGHFYFKNGVYFCKTSTNGCFSHYKNIHLYTK